MCAFNCDCLGQDGHESKAVLEAEILKIKEDIKVLENDNLSNTKIFNTKSDDIEKKLADQEEMNKKS